MEKKILETLDDGTLITDDFVDKAVSDVYSALENGTYKVIPNQHKRREPLKISNQRIRSELTAAVQG